MIPKLNVGNDLWLSYVYYYFLCYLLYLDSSTDSSAILGLELGCVSLLDTYYLSTADLNCLLLSKSNLIKDKIVLLDF